MEKKALIIFILLIFCGVSACSANTKMESDSIGSEIQKKSINKSNKEADSIVVENKKKSDNLDEDENNDKSDTNFGEDMEFSIGNIDELDVPENKDNNLYPRGMADKPVDLSDFDGIRTKGYGGYLQDKMARELNTTAIFDNDEYQESTLLCDGAIEILDAVNGTGFFVTEYRPVDGFTIYGISVGMTKDEAVKILSDQGIIEQDGYYARNIDDFYISLDIEEEKVNTIRYTKVYIRDDMEVIDNY